MKNSILVGHALETLKSIPSNSIHCVVTSPPYFGLRNYKTTHQTWPDGWIGELGAEPTPELFIAHLVLVFDEVRRVLHPSGTMWLNIGDSYANDTKWGGSSSGKHVSELHGNTSIGRERKHTGLKSKDLIGIPWMLAFALRSVGWYLRQEIIWKKNNPMPESVMDRCTKSHESIFLFSKCEKYFYDKEAIAEPLSRPDEGKRNTPARFGGRDKFTETQKQSRLHSGNEYLGTSTGTRNKRSVWTINTRPYKGAHFAVFPEELPETCIKAGTSERGCCPTCLSPWVKIIEKIKGAAPESFKGSTFSRGKTLDAKEGLSEVGMADRTIESRFVGWRAQCSCVISDPLPCIVLDPFLGSGTTAAVAKRLGRDWLGCELNRDYLPLIHKRIGTFDDDGCDL